MRRIATIAQSLISQIEISRLTIRLTAIIVLFALLAGGIILNVLKEELPEERKSRFWAFALGAGTYAALLLAS